MKAFISWRRIGGWNIQLGDNEKGYPIRDLIKPNELQTALRKEWPACTVTYNPRGFAELVLREVSYEGAQTLITYLATTYKTHPITKDRITWEFGEVIG